MQGAIAIPRHWSSTFLNNKELTDVKTWLTEDKSFVTEFTPRLGVEGPKAHSHGGFLATILDETMGSSCWYNGLPVLAANLTVRYRKSVPLNATYTCTAKIDRLESKRAMVSGRITLGETVFCESTGVFVRVPIELLKKQPDMARMVEIVESLKDGRSIADLIELDKTRRRWAFAENATAAENWDDIRNRGEKLASDFIRLATKSLQGFIR